MTGALQLLILDNHEDDVERALAALRQAGFEPRWRQAASEDEFLAHLDPSLDVILSEYGLPRFNAVRALQLLDAQGLDIPLIVVSDDLSEAIVVECIQEGAADFVHKDRMDRLVPSIEGALREKRARAARDRGPRPQRAGQHIAFQADILRNVQDSVIVSDLEGRITYWNRGAQSIFGYTREEMIGRTPEFLYPDRGETNLAKDLADILETGQYTGTWEGRRKDGSRVWIDITTTPMYGPEGEITGFIGVGKDITERRRAEAALRQSEERFSSAFRASPVAIAITSLDEQRILEVNDSFLKLFGYEEEEVLGRTSRELGLWAAPEEREALAQRLEKTGTVRNLESTGRSKDGQRLQLLASFEKVVLNGQPCILSLLHDITERVRAEGDRLHLLHALRERVKELTALHRVSRLLQDPDGDPKFLLEETAAVLAQAFQYPEVTAARVSYGNRSSSTDDFQESPWRLSTGFTTRDQVKGSVEVIYLDRRPAEAEGPFLREERELLESISEMLRSAFERRRVDQALRESEARYRELIQHSVDAILIVDLESETVLEANAGFRSLLGIESERIGGMPIFEFPDPNRRELKAALQDLRAHRALRLGERRWRRMDGTPVDVEVTLSMMRQAEGMYAMIIARDVTSRKQHERERLAIATVASALRAATSRAEMVPVVLEQIRHILDAGSAACIIQDLHTEEYTVEGAMGAWKPTEGLRIPPSEGITHRVMETGQTFAHEDARQEVEFLQPELLGEDVAVVCVPLIAEGRPIGVLWVGRPTPFTAEEIRTLNAIADISASAIHRASLQEQAQIWAAQLTTVNQLSQALTQTLDPSQVFERLANSVYVLLSGISYAFVSIYDPKKNHLTYAYGLMDGQPIKADALAPVPLQQSGPEPQSEALRTGQALIVNDLARRYREAGIEFPHGEPPPSGLYAPMFSKGEPIGVIFVQSGAPRRFTQADAQHLKLVANTAAIAISNAQLFEETNQRIEQLQALRAIDLAITSSVDLRITLKVFLEQVCTQLAIDAAAVLLLNPATLNLRFAAGSGFRSQGLEKTLIRLGQGAAGQAALDREIVRLIDLRAEDSRFQRSELIAGEDFISYFGVPLIAKGQVRGLLEIFHRQRLDPEEDWFEFLNTLSAQAAIALDNAEMFEGLQRSNVELTLAYDSTLEGWVKALDLRDRETTGHTQRVTDLTLKLARKVGVDQRTLADLRRGALLHDIGKMSIPDRILRKPDPLTEEEWEIMRRHPVHAYEFLRSIKFLRGAIDIPYCHHEKWDGSGYPRGLSGEEIPLAARIFAVADVWDALRSDRLYREAWSEEKALAYIREQAGAHFDPQVVQAFLDLLEEDRASLFIPPHAAP